MLSGREIEEDHGEFGGLTTDHGFTTDHHSDDEVNPMLAYVGRSKPSKKKSVIGNIPTTSVRPTSKKSLDDLHQTAAMLVRETRGAGLKVEVEKPKSLALFLQDLNVSKTEKAAPSTTKFEAKSWSRLLDKDQLAKLAKQKPKLSAGSDFTSSDLQVNLTILSTGIPGSSQREVEQRRSRQQIAPRAKKASIDLLNDRLDTRIAMQKKAQALQMRLDRGDDLGDERDEPRYETFKEGSRMEDLREEVDADGSSTSEEEQESAEPGLDGPGVMEAPEWRARGTTYELGRTRRPVIEDSDNDDGGAGQVVEDQDGGEDEDEEVLGALISTSDLEGDEVPGTGATKELRQTDLSRFLSGAFSPKPHTAEKTNKKTMDKTHPSGTSDKKPRDDKEKKVRSAFFEEEAEDDDDDEHGYEEEGMDEAEMEAELAQSKFIDQSADEEEEDDGVHHLDVHRAIMKADDDRALDQVLLKFARDKTLHGPASLARLDSKYNQPEEQEDDLDDYDGPSAVVVRDMTKRRDAALFKLIEEEQSDGDDYDLEDDDQSLSEDGLDPAEQEEDLEDHEDLEDIQQPAVAQDRLEDSLASLFSHPSTTKPIAHCHAFIGGKRAMATLDAERRARLLAAQDEEEQVKGGGAGGAFKKIKK